MLSSIQRRPTERAPHPLREKRKVPGAIGSFLNILWPLPGFPDRRGPGPAYTQVPTSRTMPTGKHKRSRVRVIIKTDDEVGMSQIDFKALQQNSLACALIGRRQLPTVVTNEQRRIVMANQEFVELTGASHVDELIGKDACDTLGFLPHIQQSGECSCPGCGFSRTLENAFSGAPNSNECEVGGGDEPRRFTVRGELLRMVQRRFVLAELSFSKESAHV